jgi:hypothetical protein
MVHFPGLARTRLWIQRAVTWFFQIGFPHSDILGSKPVCDSPRLIAAYRVLHRLLAPRHPPYALSSLTIKLTQHAPKSEPSPTRNQGLAIPGSPCRREGSGGFGSQLGFPRPLLLRRSGKFAFPQTLLSSKICGFASRALPARVAQCLLPSVVKDRRSDYNGTSPLPAERRVGLEPTLRKTLKPIKNPATSAGRIRPSVWASLPRALGRMCSKLVFFLPGVRNQPHLWISRQARSVSRLPRESGLYQLPASIAISKIPSSDIHDFFTCLSQCPCEIHRLLWKSFVFLSQIASSTQVGQLVLLATHLECNHESHLNELLT